MQKITNIYVLADISYKMQRHSARLTEILNRYARTTNFQHEKAKLHIIGYNDKAKIIEPFKKIQTNGNPNLGEGLKLLESVIKYQRKYDGKQTRSIFILYASENVLQGYEQPLEKLFLLKEFVFGLRYVVQYGTPDNYTKKACYRFTDSPERVLRYFSENRLNSLIRDIGKNSYGLKYK